MKILTTTAIALILALLALSSCKKELTLGDVLDPAGGYVKGSITGELENGDDVDETFQFDKLDLYNPTAGSYYEDDDYYYFEISLSDEYTNGFVMSFNLTPTQEVESAIIQINIEKKTSSGEVLDYDTYSYAEEIITDVDFDPETGKLKGSFKFEPDYPGETTVEGEFNLKVYERISK